VTLVEPILGSKAVHASKLIDISGHDDQALAASVTRDLQVICADPLAAPLEFGADFRGVRCGGRVEREHVQPGCEMLYGRAPGDLRILARSISFDSYAV
jgi:hypothetical protein